MSIRWPDEPTPPSYCAHCRRARRPSERLCPDCGDPMRPRGYCPICEAWALAEPGSDCPKHDVALLDRPEWTGLDRTSSPLVTIASFVLPDEAHGPRLRLEAEGIPAFLDGERMGTHYQVATGGVKLRVPEEFAHDARVLLAQTWSPPKSLDDDPDDP